jgi:chitosanase
MPQVKHYGVFQFKSEVSPVEIATCFREMAGMVGKIRNMFAAKSPANGGDEKEWVKAYVNARRGWLAAFPNPIVQGTVYRPDAFRVIMDAGNWDLRMPLVVRGVKIS